MQRKKSESKYKVFVNPKEGALITFDITSIFCVIFLYPTLLIADNDQGFKTFDQYSNMLEEIVFWMCKCEFPQGMVTLLLGLLPDETYKVAIN